MLCGYFVFNSFAHLAWPRSQVCVFIAYWYQFCCVHACMLSSVWLHVCLCAFVDASSSARMRVCARVLVLVCCLHVCLCMYVFKRVHAYVIM